MLRHLRTIALLAAGALGVQSGFAFSLLGPVSVDAWQIADLGYFVPGRGDVGAPKNLGEEYRQNNAVRYYACDANFLDYFGSNGLTAIDKAFTVFNQLTNASSWSPDLSEVPLESTRDNLQAASLGVTDVKSAMMTLIIESMGLADSVRYVWNLHDSFLPTVTGTPPCPFGQTYLVVMRNFDPTVPTSLAQMTTSAYVNDVLYDYQIHEYCSAPHPFDAKSEALEFSVDPDADERVPVARTGVPGSGAFFTGLTRDDVGGLRYLESMNNMNIESAGPGTLVYVTNTQPFLLTNFSLTLFAQQAATNDPVTLAGLYPGLNVSSTTQTFQPILTPVVSAALVNSPQAPLGTPAQLVFTTNFVASLQTIFHHTFNNLYIVSNSSHGLMTIPLSSIPPPNGAVLVTNFTSAFATDGTTTISNVNTRFFASNTVVGDAFILPATNCAVALISPIFTNFFAVSNVLVAITNTITTTNIVGSNTVITTSFSQGQTMFLTNRVYLALPVNCLADTPILREGIEKVTFVRRDFDSLLNRLVWDPITNEYFLSAITNNAVLGQRIQRVVTAPDYLITASDLSPGPAADRFVNAIFRSNPNYTADPGYPGLAGPGTLPPSTTITFNKAAPIFGNAGLVDTNAFLVGGPPQQATLTQTPWVVWGSFDGTTNPIIIYPSSQSIDNLENQVLVQITPAYLPDGILQSPYGAQLQTQPTATWKGPFSWTTSPNSATLPPGILLSTNGVFSGTPTLDGSYDFSVRVTEIPTQRTVDRSFSIRIFQ